MFVSRLKVIIPQIVYLFQTSFVPERSIHDNIVLTQEMAHNMHKIKANMGYFEIKVYLTKVYNIIKRAFIENIFKEMEFPLELITIIMDFITIVTTNMKWNGTRSGIFKPHIGIRQGDPISSYLFVVCMDKLSHHTSHSMEQGFWKTIKAGRHGPLISHLMFVYDLLLFG